MFKKLWRMHGTQEALPRNINAEKVSDSCFQDTPSWFTSNNAVLADLPQFAPPPWPRPTCHSTPVTLQAASVHALVCPSYLPAHGTPVSCPQTGFRQPPPLPCQPSGHPQPPRLQSAFWLSDYLSLPTRLTRSMEELPPPQMLKKLQ
jgi:hypothetical protein